MHLFNGVVWARLWGYRNAWHLALVCEELMINIDPVTMGNS